MKLKIGLRVIVIALFLIINLGSVFLLNNLFSKKQKEVSEAFENIQSPGALSELQFKTERDSLIAKALLNRFNESSASVLMIQNESRVYSALMLFLLSMLSVGLFVVVFYIITKPLKEIQKATSRIREGDFSVRLRENGIHELRMLKQSFNDMSRELDNVQRKLVFAEKEMIWKELSRILAHEIKNPLTPIQLSIERLEDKFGTDFEKFKEIFPEAVRIIYQEIANLREVVQSFSNYAKITQPDKLIFDPAEMVKEIVVPYKHDYKVNLELETGSQVCFDKMHFYQIMTNIFQNAMDASEKQGEITVALKSSRSYLVLQIIDKGTGIETEDIQRIFEPYFTKKSKGTGIGLALVKKLCDINNALIRVKSKVGQGTQFELIMEKMDENSHCR